MLSEIVFNKKILVYKAYYQAIISPNKYIEAIFWYNLG